MTSIPFIIVSLEGFIEIFIYLSELHQRNRRGRIKGIKGIKAIRHFSPHSFIPFILFIPSSGCGWVGSSGVVKGGGDVARRCKRYSLESPNEGNANPDQTLVTQLY